MIQSEGRQKGFSFIEVVACIALLGMLSGMAIGGLKSLSTYTFNHFVSQTRQLIQSAQQQASRENNIYRVSYLEEDGQRLIKKTHVEINGAESSGNEKLIVPEGVEVTISTDEVAIMFSKDMSIAKAATIQIINERIGRQVDMTVQVATGEIVIEEGGNE